jgi:hypothetical protein
MRNTPDAIVGVGIHYRPLICFSPRKIPIIFLRHPSVYPAYAYLVVNFIFGLGSVYSLP